MENLNIESLLNRINQLEIAVSKLQVQTETMTKTLSELTAALTSFADGTTDEIKMILPKLELSSIATQNIKALDDRLASVENRLTAQETNLANTNKLLNEIKNNFWKLVLGVITLLLSEFIYLVTGIHINIH
ncbi:MAG: hypothetical protein QXV17_14290 [Candidatus Micrarchaeaceae archaeon]